MLVFDSFFDVVRFSYSLKVTKNACGDRFVLFVLGYCHCGHCGLCPGNYLPVYQISFYCSAELRFCDDNSIFYMTL